MKTLYSLVLISIMALPVYSQSINWFTGSFEEARLQAENEQKELLLYFTASWCGPCRQMEKTTYADPNIIDVVNDKLVSYKADVDEAEGLSLFFQYSNESSVVIPLFARINPADDKVLRSKTGMMNVEVFSAFLQEEARPEESYAPKEAEEVRSIMEGYSTSSPSTSLLWRMYTSDIKLGLRVGYTRSNLVSADMQTNDFNQHIGGISAELFVDYTTSGKFLFQGGLGFTPKGAWSEELNQSLNLQYLELPLRVSYTLFNHRLVDCPQPVRITFIPYGAYALGGNWRNENRTENVRFGKGINELNRWDYGIKAGLSLDLGSFESSFGYDVGLGNVSNTPGMVLNNRGFYFSMALIWGK
jgi:thiol-disulfide isomerase/thioredoxin